MARYTLAAMLTALALAIGASPVSSQAPSRLAATLAAITHYPIFFHGRAVALVATPARTDGWWEAPLEAGRRFVILPQSGAPPLERTELHGILFDVGHLAPDDTRVDGLGIRPVVAALSPDRWPDRGALFVLANATWVDPPDESTSSLRAIVLSPADFDGRTVTVRGRFRAQNLYGDLPAWPRQSKWDFVLQTADASLWVTGLRPKGAGIDLDPTTRRNAGSWLEATGTIHIANGLPRLEAKTVRAARPEEEQAPGEAAVPVPQPPPAVIFSAPLDGEADVDPGIRVRIQFSRNMKPASFEGRVQAAYGPDSTAAPPKLTVTYQPDTRSIEVRFASALARGATVIIRLDAGIEASDGTPLGPTTVTFRIAS